MVNDSIEVEMNLTTAREKGREEEERRTSKDLTQLSPLNTLEIEMERMIEAMERLMERYIVSHNPPTMTNHDFREPLCGEKT